MPSHLSSSSSFPATDLRSWRERNAVGGVTSDGPGVLRRGKEASSIASFPQPPPDMPRPPVPSSVCLRDSSPLELGYVGSLSCWMFPQLGQLPCSAPGVHHTASFSHLAEGKGYLLLGIAGKWRKGATHCARHCPASPQREMALGLAQVRAFSPDS